MIIGITGYTYDKQGQRGVAGAGKDEAAKHLTEKYKGGKVSCADPLKEIAKKVYAFTDEQLWGPSWMRNASDVRYPRPNHKFDVAVEMADGSWLKQCVVCGAHADTEELCYLTPRYALQRLGTEWGRDCWPDTWAAAAVRGAEHLLSLLSGPKVVAIPDVRFPNEVEHIKKAGGKVIRIKREFEKVPLVSTHPSETSLLDWKDEEFDFVIENNGTIDSLYKKVDSFMDWLTGRIRPYDPSQADVPPFKRT